MMSAAQMTHDEIEKIDAGPKLDALVAEKVMGMKFGFPKPPHWPALREKSWLDEDGTPYNIRELKFSTSIAAAWQIVEKLADSLPQGFTVRSPGFDQRWIAEWKFDHMGVLDDGFMQGDTAPLAICRAALKAVSA